MTHKKTSERQMAYAKRRRDAGLCVYSACKEPPAITAHSSQKPLYCLAHRLKVNEAQARRWRENFGKVKAVPQPDITFGEAT